MNKKLSRNAKIVTNDCTLWSKKIDKHHIFAEKAMDAENQKGERKVKTYHIDDLL